MQRYHLNNCNSAVNNSLISGIQPRDASRSESSANYTTNSRRSSQVTPYKARCDKEQLNPRLGPPDFNPQTPTCPEETLTRDYAQSGYRDTVEGLEEAREISLSHVQAFNKPHIVKWKEAIKKRHRAINESRAQKRKAGQVYGVPLSGALLTKPGIFPEQRPCSEDFRRKWIEGLSQPHKRLRSLADHVPHGYRRRSLFEVLIRNNVPLTRATWFIKVTYLNQVRVTSNSSSTTHDKTQFSRCEQWTKDVIDYLQSLLDEFVTRNNSYSSFPMRDRSSQMVYASSVQPKGDPFTAVMDGEEPSLYNKWWYVVRIIQWHHVEGLVVPSLIIDWVLNQLQEKELLGVLQLLLPIIYGFIEIVILSQTYVRTLVRIATRFIQEPSPGGSDLVDNSRRAYTSSAVVEMLRYLILAVPDTFVALDCFPLPKSVASHLVNDGNFLPKLAEDARNMKDSQLEVASAHKDKNHEVQAESLSFHSVVSSIQCRAETLSRAARPNHCGHSVAKALQLLDQALRHGDIGGAYKFLFEDPWDGAIAERWVAEVSSNLYTSLKHIGRVTLFINCSIFFICEWATCEYRDFRNVVPSGLKFTGRKDYSEIFIAIRLLKLMMKNIPSMHCSNRKGKDVSDTFESLGPLHDAIVCWIDQHEVQNGEGFKRLQLLIRELVCSGIFNPQAYVRQLIVSGIMDGNGSKVDMERRKKHCKLLKHLPAPYVCDALVDAHFADPQTLLEAASVYSNERRLALHGLLGERKFALGPKSSTKRRKYNGSCDGGNVSPSFFDQSDSQAISSLSPTDVETNIKLEELKVSISSLLQLRHPSSSASSVLDESQVTLVRSDGIYNRAIAAEETSGCEECRRTKRQKLSEERSSHLQSSPAEEEDLWWVRKGMKYVEPLKSEQPPKPAKQAPRGRQKTVRKTQSLAHLAATRIEGSQGASPSHVCESKIGCPHHRTGSDDVRKSIDGIKTPSSGDIVSIGKILKQMKFAEKRTITKWLISVIKQALEEAEKNVLKIGQHSKPHSAAEDRSSTRWKLGEDELAAALYIMDTCNELVSATRFLLWLLSKVPCNSGSATHSRNVLIIPRFAENHACEVGEAFLLSSIRRYENIIVAADLIPEILSATMRRAASVLESNGRLSSSPAFVYARHILKKYSNAVSVVEWEKDFKSSCDKRLSSELQSGKSEGDLGFSFGVPNGVEDLDDYFRQRISGHRVSRVGLNMKDIVHKLVDEAAKDRKSIVPGTNKSPSIENLDGVYLVAHQVVTALMDCMRQTGGAAQEGDPSLVSSAVAAIVNNVALIIARIPDLPSSSNHSNHPSPSSSLLFARRILRIHMACLCILKEALGERQSRVFEVALATEASSALVQTLAPGKAQNLPNDASNHSHKAVLGKAGKVTAAVSALVIGAILQGVSSLDRMVTLFKLRDGLDLIQFARSMKSNVNGHARSSGPIKVDHLVEVSLNWFRVLVGNCRTVSDGLIVRLLGEPSVIALSRMQRMLSLSLVLPPAYSIFAFVIWRPILDASFGVREEFSQLYQLSAVAITDAIKHMPFREICLRDTRGFYELVSGDTLDLDFISLLESFNSEIKLKASVLVPLRSRLFLDALLDCKVSNVVEVDEGKRASSPSELKKQCGENVKKLVGRLVNVLDTLQPARFHWQWVQLRLFLNEQAVNEKMENDGTFSEAIKSLSANPDKSNACDNESNFIQIILTRLLVRPDAAPFFSEVIHLLGKSLQDSILSQAKWLLRGSEVLYGRKSIRQKVLNIAADLKDLPMKPQYWKPWGWYQSENNIVTNRGDKGKSEAGTLEEGEVVDERPDFNQFGKGSGVLDVEGFIVSQQHATERALMKLILPCLDQGSDDLRYNFASEMIKQMSNIEQKINAVTRGDGKVAATSVPAIGSPPSKSSSRKTGKNSSSAVARQSTGSSDTVPPSPTALRSSLTLRLQFLLRLLRVIWSDREPSGRNMRYTLASVILRLLGSRVVHEDVTHIVNTALATSKRDGETLLETSTLDALSCGENLFDCLLLVLHALLSSSQPSWLKLKSESNATDRRNEYSIFDREVAEGLQNELDCMELPQRIRWRIQAAMPILFPASRSSISCQATLVSPAAITCLQPSNPVTFLNPSSSSVPQRTPVFPGRNSANSKSKSQTTHQDPDQEIDPWTLLEDGAGSGQRSPNSAGSTDHSNLKASNLVKGAVRVRRTYLTYIGTVDEDS